MMSYEMMSDELRLRLVLKIEIDSEHYIFICRDSDSSEVS